MKYICFFSNGHNGDIVHSKTFIEDITNQLDIPCFHHHKKNPIITKDLSSTFTQIAPLDNHAKFIETEKIFFVNTWLFPYVIDHSFVEYAGINMETNYKIYSDICDVINQKFNKKIKLKSIEYYLPFINFNNVERGGIKNFITSNPNKKVLLCNGPCMTGQSCYNENLKDLIERLSQKYKNIIFIATEKFKTNFNNIFFTDDIIKINNCDLNEIGYLSTFCDLIIGKNSGPFCFSTNKDNYNDEKKVFFAFGHNESDCFYKNVSIKAKFIFHNSENKDMIDQSIEKTIQKYLL